MADILAPHFSDSNKARAYLEKMRWPEGPICTHCGLLDQAYRLEAKEGSKAPVRKGVWKCAGCREQFTVTVGTIFEDSHIPLNKWLLTIRLLCASKKGMSAHQLHRMLGLTYKSAWFMAHRIRYAMSQEPLSSKLNGTAEVDEAYIGGKEKGVPGMPTPERSKKVPVIAMVERSLVKGKSRVRSRAVERVTVENLRPVLGEHISENARLNTDEATVYYMMHGDFAGHGVVTHKSKKYARYEDGRLITTNTAEGFFSLLKRRVHCVYHHVGRQHLHRYLSEFDFRYNARGVSDTERATIVTKGMGGKEIDLSGLMRTRMKRKRKKP